MLKQYITDIQWTDRQNVQHLPGEIGAVDTRDVDSLIAQNAIHERVDEQSAARASDTALAEQSEPATVMPPESVG